MNPNEEPVSDPDFLIRIEKADAYRRLLARAKKIAIAGGVLGAAFGGVVGF